MLPSTLAQHVLGVAGRLYPSPSPAAAAAPSPEPSPGAESKSRRRLSIAQLTEEQATRPGVTITYIASHRSESPDGKFAHTARQMRRIYGRANGGGAPAWERGSWYPGGKWIPEKDENIPEEAWKSHHQQDTGSRCGFTWDDAAAKANLHACTKDRDCQQFNVNRSRWDFDENGKWKFAHTKYACWKDLPDYQRSPQGDCITKNPYRMSDLHCQLTCGAWLSSNSEGICSENCECTITSAAWDPGSPIQEHDVDVPRKDMPKKSHELLMQTRMEYDQTPSGLPACRWQADPSCTHVTQYECFDGPASQGAGKWENGAWKPTAACSHENWFGKKGCERSCVHVNLLKPAPYYAIWNPGPRARDPRPAERMPLYKHEPDRMTPELRGISMQNLDSVMSRICKSDDHRFLAFTMYSARYEDKALRLVRSCDRAGVCCKAVLLPRDAFGKHAPEGSLQFRFETISMKPAFIMEQIRLIELPIVYMDSDLEFHRFPDLFLNRGSWPYYDRDAMFFNYWGNETAPATKFTAHIGSGVLYFNNGIRAHNLLRAWCQAMAYPPNLHAPDDQVLDLLYSQGGWSKRASWGWLPASYMRTMPAYYRGVVPVIEHDHGTAPGVVKHSEVKPVLPPVDQWQLLDPGAECNANRSLNVDADGEEWAAEKREEDEREEARLKEDCKKYGIGTPQCPRPPAVKKLCDPRERIESMDRWYDVEPSAKNNWRPRRKSKENDCRMLCEGPPNGKAADRERPWCIHYKWKAVKGGVCMLWDKMPDECLELRHRLHKATKRHRQLQGRRRQQHVQGRRRQHGHQLHPFIQE